MRAENKAFFHFFFSALRISLGYTLFVAYGPFVLSGQVLPALAGDFAVRFFLHWLFVFMMFMLFANIMLNQLNRR